MNYYQDQYAFILKELLHQWNKKIQSRNGEVYSSFFKTIKVDMRDEFPLMDIKKIRWENIVTELIWFLNGNSNIHYLRKNKNRIWDNDAYEYYLTKYAPISNEPPVSKQRFRELVDSNKYILIKDPLTGKTRSYYFGDLDRIYGKQWVNFGGSTNQIKNVLEKLKTNPDDRRMIVTAHNPKDIEDNVVGLPSCHNMFQFYTIPLSRSERIAIAIKKLGENNIDPFNNDELDKNRIPKYWLSLWFNLRSNDFFLGQPYNMASYALLLKIFSHLVNMEPKNIACSIIDCHLYEAHLDAANEWLKRYDKRNSCHSDAKCTANVKIKNLVTIEDITMDNIQLNNYTPEGYIAAPLLTKTVK